MLEKRRDEIISLRPLIYVKCLRMVRKEADPKSLAEDLAQEVIIKALTKLYSFRGEAAVSSWVFRITHNLVLDHLRRSRRNPLNNINMNTVPADGFSQNLIDVIQKTDTHNNPHYIFMRKLLITEIESLPQKQRRIVQLRVAGYNSEEVSNILEIPNGTVKSNYSRFVHKLAEKYQTAA